MLFNYSACTRILLRAGTDYKARLASTVEKIVTTYGDGGREAVATEPSRAVLSTVSLLHYVVTHGFVNE